MTLPNPKQLLSETLQKPQKITMTSVILLSLLVGCHALHFKMNYTLCIIFINYEPVVLWEVCIKK